MDMVVCVKQIIDPVTPASLLEIDMNGKRAQPKNPKLVKLVVSDYDLNAVEAALKIRDANGGKITVISLGAKSAIEAIRECIAMGADEGFLLNDPFFDESNTYSTAYSLSKAIRKIGLFDLILCGVQEGDWDAGQVGSGIAKFLGIPCITAVGKAEVKDNKRVAIERVVGEGRESVEVPTPALLSVRSEIGAPRYPTMKKQMAAKKKEIPIWNAKDIAADETKVGDSAVRIKLMKLAIPIHEAKCEFVKGQTPEEAGSNLALRLKEAKLI